MSNEKKADQQVSIRLPRGMYHELQETAKRERRSMNAQILKILEEVVDGKAVSA